MNKIKYYGFLGDPCYDFVIYLADILSCFNKSILVADYSENKSVLRCIPKPKKQMEFIHYGGIDYIGECFLKEEQIAVFEIVFVILPSELFDNISFWTEESGIEIKWDRLYVFTDFRKENLESISTNIRNISCDIHIIYRDKFSNKISIDYCKQNYFVECENIKSECIIYMDEYDYEKRIMLEYEGYTGFYNISYEFQKCLFSKSSEILGLPAKIIIKEYKRKKWRKI